MVNQCFFNAQYLFNSAKGQVSPGIQLESIKLVQVITNKTRIVTAIKKK